MRYTYEKRHPLEFAIICNNYLLAICPSDCSDRGSCSGRSTPPSCSCYAGWTGEACNVSASLALLNGKLNAAQQKNDTSNTSTSSRHGVSAVVVTVIVCAGVLVVVAALIIALWVGPERFRSLVAEKPKESPAYISMKD